MNKEKLEQLKEEISKMTKAEQIRQLEWSDHHEFSYGYAYYLLEENQQLEKIINKAIEYISECCLYDEETKIFNDDLDYYEIPKLIEILKGGSDE